MLTGRLSVATHPWIGDHVLGDAVVFPGTGFLELAVPRGRPGRLPASAGAHLGRPDGARGGEAVRRPGRGGRRPTAAGRRDLRIHSPARRRPDSTWTHHATPACSRPGRSAAARRPSAVAPGRCGSRGHRRLLRPDGGRRLSTDPSFEGLRALWRRGEDLYAEGGVPQAAPGRAAAYGLHPALLDAALQASLVLRGQTRART
ncbi:polyketide synthase dehydratase domain-containing protein [Amycolatopsis balhimycina]|uniref:polyketide synthase dehydratase domain-containing protein n=1 Tax=Amycolatopsis balhimycina TaxID=208443 RepID=UPI0012FCE2B2